ncbi:MAG: TMEM43 family protein, partial [Spirochaetes bacterium]|nr:TMEM43 family protein [Spirochaetota bacterium]
MISLTEPKMNSTNNGKLIHFSGEATTSDVVSDPTIGISENGIKLQRHVEMYQWKEITSSKTQKKLGGGTETTTEYRYEKGWSNTLINSNNFKVQTGHQNPASME